MSESTYIFVDNLGLVTYRFVLPDRDVQWILHKAEGGGVG